MPIDYLDKFKGSLLGVAIGDTLGHPFEGMLRDAIKSNFTNFGDFIINNRRLFNTFTDDTQLTLHTAQSLIQGGGFNLHNFIEEYVKWLDDPPIGAGYGCITAARKLKYRIPWKEAASNSGGNGTTMRIAPIGLFYNKDIKALKSAAIKSSIITHSHPAASAGAVVIANAIAYLIDKEPKSGFSIDQFFDVVISSISNSHDEIWEEFCKILGKLRSSLDLPIEAGLIKFSQSGVKSPYFIEQFLGKAFVHPYTISTVVCVLFIFLNNLDSFKRCIYILPTVGGDTDTCGAIGGSIAGAYFGFKRIPDKLVTIVKDSNGLIQLAKRLYESFKNEFF